MRVIGTAGHVDHGKSTLVAALTGTHPDRLKEEQEREMTIDLGFAWLSIPGGIEAGIIDVPGHIDFIENMLAGVGAIDACIFVVAADEGVMPQTKEHLAILDLLSIPGGVIALTKIDLIQDQEWIDLVIDEIHQIVQDTILDSAEIVPVSAITREGIPALIQAINHSLGDRTRTIDLGLPRLPIDRVFTIAGFGTVVTGTLKDGRFSVGDEVEVLPTGLRGRIRGLQSHNRKVNDLEPGGRTAVNIGGIPVEAIQRGNVLAHPGDYTPTRRLDVSVRLLKDASDSLKHNTECKLFVNTDETISRVRLLGSDALRPGEEGWLQLEPVHPVVVANGDRFILRRPSPGETIGGGTILDPYPLQRYRRFSQEIYHRLTGLSGGETLETVALFLAKKGCITTHEMYKQAHIDQTSLKSAIHRLMIDGRALTLKPGADPNDPKTTLIDAGYFRVICEKILAEVQAFHTRQPLRQGISREELKSRQKLDQRLFNAAVSSMIEKRNLRELGPIICSFDHQILFNPDQKMLVAALFKEFIENNPTPPTIKECIAAAGGEIYNALVELGELIELSDEIVFRKQELQEIQGIIIETLQKQETITVAQIRDGLNTSRKYALAILEYLDSLGLTVREGDVRKLRRGFV